MPRWVLYVLGFAAVAVPVAVALSSGAASQLPGGDDLGPEDDGVQAFTKRVRNLSRLNGPLRAELRAFIDWWSLHGPFVVTIGEDGGVRTDEALQKQHAAAKASNATTLAQTPHSLRVQEDGLAAGEAVDLWPYQPETVGRTWEPAFDLTDPETLRRYTVIGTAGKRFGLVWGGDFQSLRDYPHLETAGWRSRPWAGPVVA